MRSVAYASCLLAVLGCGDASATDAESGGAGDGDAADSGAQATGGDLRVAYQSAPYSVNPSAQWAGTTTLEEMRGWGDFGVGALEGFKAELVIDQQAYVVDKDGVPRAMAEDELGLYTIITKFEADKTSELQGPTSCDELTASVLPSLLPDPNGMYAIRIDGQFSQAQPRSFQGWDPPYPLAIVLITSGEVRFELTDVSGAIIAYYFPPGAGSFCSLGSNCSQEGFHMHFITDDRQAGGHLLSCAIDSGTVSISSINELRLRMLDGTTETYGG